MEICESLVARQSEVPLCGTGPGLVELVMTLVARQSEVPLCGTGPGLVETVMALVARQSDVPLCGTGPGLEALYFVHWKLFLLCFGCMQYFLYMLCVMYCRPGRHH
jgi:hypothetical protein